MTSKIQHSVKVPRLYKVATAIFKNYKNGLGSVKTLVYDSRKKHPNQDDPLSDMVKRAEIVIQR